VIACRLARISTNHRTQSKHLVNVFKEAKSAYREKKAELKAARDEVDEKSRPSKHGSREHSRRRSHERTEHGKLRHQRPPVERGYTDSFYTNDHINESPTRTRKASPGGYYLPEESELLRRNSDSNLRSLQTIRRKPTSSRQNQVQEADIDMDLAYGEFPPPLPPRRYSEEGDLRSKMTALNRMLEEANCVHHSATQIIKSLESNPEAMAAVALSLAEISSLMTKMAPGALMSMKGAFPAIIALLLSPEFLIAVGVGLGVTVVALGGYKIIKKIKKAQKGKDGQQVELEAGELEDVTADMSKVKSWRRGIPLAEEAQSAGTSVEAEYVTPAASLLLKEAGRREEMPWRARSGEREAELKDKETVKVKDKKLKKESKSTEKEVSGLRMLFRKKDAMDV